MIITYSQFLRVHSCSAKISTGTTTELTFPMTDVLTALPPRLGYTVSTTRSCESLCLVTLAESPTKKVEVRSLVRAARVDRMTAGTG